MKVSTLAAFVFLFFVPEASAQTDRRGIQGLNETQSQREIDSLLRSFHDSQRRLKLRLNASRRFGESVHRGMDAGQAGSLYRQQMQRMNRFQPGGQTPFFRQQLLSQ